MKSRHCIIVFNIIFLVPACLYAQQLLVRPYLQPGNASTLTKEEKVLIWQTDSVAATFTVEYVPGKAFASSGTTERVKPTVTLLILNNKTTRVYRAILSGLRFDTEYTYRVMQYDQVLSTGTFTSRTKNARVRFAVFGDCGAGTPQQAQIASQVFQQQPQFVLVTGDNVYSRGLESEYRKNFFPAYTSPKADPSVGAPLMQSIPFYMLVGNHDIYGQNLDKYPDGLAYFYYNDLPLNAPVPTSTLVPAGSDDKIKAFKKAAGKRYPGMTNYSFDYGNVHIVCLDANTYINPLDPALISWLSDDLRATKADWKIVAWHHPSFNTSKTHYNDQIMRLLSPTLEQLGIDLVLTGHVHNYQRTRPLTFEPQVDDSKTRYVITDEGRVNGTFHLDTLFDGVHQTKPKGIIYIVTGAGGAVLYDKDFGANPDLWKHDPPENWVPFTVTMITDKHSFTLIETDGKKLTLRQLDAQGTVLDSISITR
jgi:hypothetical protein